MQCHACQTTVPLASGESIGFRDLCDACRADLHVCLNCSHSDPSAYNGCREPNAERVLDRDRANRCDYFRPLAEARAADPDRNRALSELERLFQKR